MKMTKDGFEDAKAFIKANARDLEKTLFAYYFEKGSAGTVIEALGAFQNADGGFGHGIESDVRMKGSHTLGTTVALQTLRKIRAASDHPMVKRGIQYLIESYDSEFETWTNVPIAVNDAAHAPWWTVEEGQKPQTLIGESGEDVFYNANPSAEIVGYLNAYKELVPKDFLEKVTSQAVKNFDYLEDPIEGHTLLCYARALAELGKPHQSELSAKMAQRALLAIPLKPSEWATGYVILPNEYAPAPDAPLAPLIGEALRLSLEFEITNQNEDGSWQPGWQWGMYEDEWETAKVEWAGVITLNSLVKFKNFGMIEE